MQNESREDDITENESNPEDLVQNDSEINLPNQNLD